MIQKVCRRSPSKGSKGFSSLFSHSSHRWDRRALARCRWAVLDTRSASSVLSRGEGRLSTRLVHHPAQQELGVINVLLFPVELEELGQPDVQELAIEVDLNDAGAEVGKRVDEDL
jgi:hypothetical protein